MITKKTAQQIVDTVKDVCGYDINFINEKGIILASTDHSRAGTFHEIGKQVITEGRTIEVNESGSFHGTQKGVNIPVSHNGSLIAVIGISGRPDDVRKYAYLAEKITRLLIREQELNAASHSLNEKKQYLIQTLLRGNLENPQYLFEMLHEFQISEATKKRVLLIRLNGHDSSLNLSAADSRIHQLFTKLKSSIVCFQYPDQFTAMIESDAISEARAILEPFISAHKNTVFLGIGETSDIYHLDASLHTAQIALKSLQGTDQNIALYDDLTLEIILASIDSENRKAFLSKTLSALSAKDIALLETYFEEGQSLSRTCDRLYLHKNTLQYKLDRIHRICSYNPRSFKDAVTLYLAVQLCRTDNHD